MNECEEAKNCIANLSENVIHSSFRDKMMPLADNFVPGPCDVICGRGKAAYGHPGNQRFRKLVEKHLQSYSEATSKLEKSGIVSYIIELIREACPSCVGFVKLNNGRWHRVRDNVAREKVGQSFRDLLHTKYRSSNKAKNHRQKEKKNRRISEESSFEFKSISVKAESGPEESQTQENGICKRKCNTVSNKNPQEIMLDIEPIDIFEATNCSFSNATSVGSMAGSTELISYYEELFG